MKKFDTKNVTQCHDLNALYTAQLCSLRAKLNHSKSITRTSNPEGLDAMSGQPGNLQLLVSKAQLRVSAQASEPWYRKNSSCNLSRLPS